MPAATGQRHIWTLTDDRLANPILQLLAQTITLCCYWLRLLPFAAIGSDSNPFLLLAQTQTLPCYWLRLRPFHAIG